MTKITKHSLLRLRSVSTLAVLAGAAASLSGCLERPLATDQPVKSTIYVDRIEQTVVDKIDLLFMVDNSASMKDKQAILSEAVPNLVERLVNPPCVTVDADGNVTDSQPADADGGCTTAGAGYSREFNPVNDIHIGVITSSLGDFGMSSIGGCGPDPTGRNFNDRAWLLPQVRTGLTGQEAEGYLAWTDSKDQTTFINQFKAQIEAVGEVGCGFEMSLEAWYRFLVDPAPTDYTWVGRNDKGGIDTNYAMNKSVETGENSILAQRAAFLRPDSLVAIEMLTDENDCSANPNYFGGTIFNWSGLPYVMTQPTVACQTDPNSVCCTAGEIVNDSLKSQCSAEQLALDFTNYPDTDGMRVANTVYSTKTETTKDSLANSTPVDAPNTRCFDHKRRFGFDFLYPTKRYSNALSLAEICPDAADLTPTDTCRVPNPLYAYSGTDADGNVVSVIRSKDLVFLGGILGVPYDLITKENGNSTRSYYTASELESESAWDKILGSADGSTGPTDVRMVESRANRGGDMPAPGAAFSAAVGYEGLSDYDTNAAPVSEGSTTTRRTDLQFACTFELSTPIQCVDKSVLIGGTSITPPAGTNYSNSCDCADNGGAVVASQNPLCRNPDTGAAAVGTPVVDGDSRLMFPQYSAKAYPSVRELQVLREFGKNSIVSSICPWKPLSSQNGDIDYGYNSAVDALVNRLKEQLSDRCLPRPLVVKDNAVPCQLVEVNNTPTAGSCGCDNAIGRYDLDPATRSAMDNRLSQALGCSIGGTDPSKTSCDDYCGCEFRSASALDADKGGNANQTACLNDTSDTSFQGWCYVGPSANGAEYDYNEDLVSKCAANRPQKLRFPAAGSGGLQKNTSTFIACVGTTENVTAPPSGDGGTP